MDTELTRERFPHALCNWLAAGQTVEHEIIILEWWIKLNI